MPPEKPLLESAGTTAATNMKPASPESGRKLNWIPMLVGAMFWLLVIGSIAAFFSPTVALFINKWWWAFGLGLLCVLFLGLLPDVRRKLVNLPFATQAALIVFVGLPGLLAGVSGIYYILPNVEARAMALRAIFLIVVCFLPASMWYLFIVTRKASLLNEFVGNLDRLGLLIPQVWRTETAESKESEPSRRRRIEAYLQKFEAVYGDLPDIIHTDVFDGVFRRYSRADTAGARTLSTAAFAVALYTLLIALGWMITLPPITVVSNFRMALEPTASPVTLAFLGAYFFSLQMLFRRYVRNDLGGPAYVAASIRIILATIGIWAVAAVGQSNIINEAGNSTATAKAQELLLLAGFVFGVFPRVIWQIIQSLFQKVASLAVPSMMSQLPVSDLDGLTVWHQARLEEEDIENIPNMANADVVELMLNTPYPSEQIIDWVDQAILYTQLGPKETQSDDPRQKLRIYGIRTATSLLSISAESQHRGNRDAFDKILTSPKGDGLVAALEVSLTTNTNLELIRRWRSSTTFARGD